MTRTPSTLRGLLPLQFVLLLLLLGAVISANVVPNLFLVDDNNYLVNVLAVRQGHVTVSNTRELPPSPELLFFEPGPRSRAVTSTPVASTAPPLYGPIALPFSWLGWRGLVGLSTLAYLVTTAIVFVSARRYAKEASTAWLAAGAFALGSFVIEYALGLWPHTLSLALCTGGLVAAGRAIETGRWTAGTIAGVLLGVAAGIRYQNIVVVIAAGIAILVLGFQRRRTLAAFMAAAAVPLAVSSLMNHARLGSWNPISKGKGYLTVPVVDYPGTSIFEPFVLLWAQLVDFSAWPTLVGPIREGWVTYDPTTGAHLMLGVTLKKAVLQSAPWVGLALLFFAMAWTRRSRMPEPQRIQLRLFSLVIAAILLVFSMAGATRNDGLTFNARYLLEILPFAAIAFAWALDGIQLPWRPMVAGCAAGGMLVLLILIGLPLRAGQDDVLWTLRQLLLLKVPLLLAALLAASWLLLRRGVATQKALVAVVGVCLGWAFMLHADDIVASQRIRRFYLARTQALAGVLTDRSAFVAWWGNKHAAGPLLFDRDIVILDAYADSGRDAPLLIRTLLAAGRRVVLLPDDFPADVLERVLSGFQVTPIERPGMTLMELRLGAM